MNEVQHLWNVINHLSSNTELEMISLQSYYVARCRGMGSEVQLPNNIFGSGSMCSYCGSLWSQVDHRVRFESGVKPAKSVQKILNEKRKAPKSHQVFKTVRETLAKKALLNSGNRAIIRCSFCSKYTKVNMTKPARLKPPKESIDSNESQSPVTKKRKKRTKDKTAGLIIAPIKKSQNLNKTPKVESTRVNVTQKVKSTNLNKLGAMINRNLTPSKKSSLHDFIKDLGGS